MLSAYRFIGCFIFTVISNTTMKKLLLSSVFLLTACQNNRIGATEVGALGGAAAGAGLGAIIGNQSGRPGAGVAIGSAVGALGGALIGGQVDRTDRRIDERERRIEDQQRQIDENRRLLEELRERGIDVRNSERGVVVNLPDVLFETGKANLTNNARTTTREIADVLLRAPSRRVAVEGHTDSVGTIDYNYRLSDARARAVASELEKNGLPHQSIAIRALGETEPLATNTTEAGRRRNRRVEVVIENERGRP
jgi:outer membrane protein OmpA-like peptidoglycan-associated protein